MKRFVLELIKLYQSTVSRVTPPACRFEPTCSHYTYEAIQKYGLVKGSWLAAKRLARCHPWSDGGYDPVP
ncbi:MAG: membrane protein insertion efficiency factor YidD [Dehalococcoidia bacterium]|nr:membrane protein insertion efficiency factor YidD [Dehalococcoidia bacterium]